MAMIVADSDVLIDYLRDRDPSASRIEIELQTRSFATTAITAFELWAGARSRRQGMAVEALLAAMTLLPLDDESARKAAEVKRSLIARGEEIGAADCLIAGICLVYGATLLTNNRRHFERVAGLKLGVHSQRRRDQ
jgi:tRNA(fMet)-specific endonuclease VapC